MVNNWVFKLKNTVFVLELFKISIIKDYSFNVNLSVKYISLVCCPRVCHSEIALFKLYYLCYWIKFVQQFVDYRSRLKTFWLSIVLNLEITWFFGENSLQNSNIFVTEFVVTTLIFVNCNLVLVTSYLIVIRIFFSSFLSPFFFSGKNNMKRMGWSLFMLYFIVLQYSTCCSTGTITTNTALSFMVHYNIHFLLVSLTPEVIS